MKRKGIHYIAGLIGVVQAVLMAACQMNTQWSDFEYYQVQKTEQMREEPLERDLQDGEDENFAQIHEDEPRDMLVKVDLQFLKTDNDATAKVCRLINEQLKEMLLHQDGKLTDDEAVANYIEDVKADFRANAIWEMYSEELTGRVEYGFDHIINYRLVEESFAGGAHPSSVTTILRFNAQTGEFLPLENVFPTHRQERLKELLLQRLMENQGVNNLEELRAKGYLEQMDLFISNNFALREDSIEFYYNEYDIAPYSAGACTLCLSYEEAKEVMDTQRQKEKP